MNAKMGKTIYFVFIDFGRYLFLQFFDLVSILEADRASFSAIDLRSCVIVTTIYLDSFLKTKMEMILEKQLFQIRIKR